MSRHPSRTRTTEPPAAWSSARPPGAAWFLAGAMALACRPGGAASGGGEVPGAPLPAAPQGEVQAGPLGAGPGDAVAPPEAPAAVVPEPLSGTADEALRGPLDPPEWVPLATYGGRPVEILRELDPTGTKLMRIHTVLADGQPDAPGEPSARRVAHGPDWRFFESGFAARVEHWREGELHGPYRSWWPTAQLREEGAYDGGRRVGPWRRATREGRLAEEGTYVAGEREGVHRTWFANGQLEEEAGYRAGVPHGVLRRFGRDGAPLLEAHYEAGALHGPWSDHYPEGGALREFGAYERGRKVGPWRCARADAQGLLLEERYTDGVRDGLQRTWDAGGTLVLEKTFVAGAETGPTRSWYPGGAPQSEGHLRAGKRVGPWTYWSPDGSVNARWSGTYEDDVRVGP